MISGSKLALALAATTALVTFSNSVMAQSIPPSADPLRFKRSLDNAPLRPRGSDMQLDAPKYDQPIQGGVQSFVLSSVNITGSTVYSPDQLAPLYAQYVGKTVSNNELNAIASAITAKYRQDGYILSRAVISPQNVSGGRLNLTVNEGAVTNVVYQNVSENRKSLIEGFAANITAKRPLDMKTLERNLLLIDDLPGVKARGFLRPAAGGGNELVISLENKAAEYSVQADNRGSRYLGRYQLTGVGAFNSAMDAYDRLTVRGIITGEGEELRYLDITEEQQIGSDGTKVELKGSYAHAQPGGRISELDLQSKSGEIDLAIKHPVIRSRSENLEAFGGLNYVDTDYDIGTAALYNDGVRSVYLGASYDKTDSLSGINQITGQVRQGLDVLNARNGDLLTSRSNGESAFTLVRGEASRLQSISQNFSLLVAANGQYTKDPLFAPEQFSVGGPQYGRAHDPAEIGGDVGYAAKAELRFGSDVQNPFLSSYQLYTYYDFGQAWLNDVPSDIDDKETLASAGVGVRFNMPQDLTGYLEFNYPLVHTVDAEGGAKEDPRVFFMMNKRM